MSSNAPAGQASTHIPQTVHLVLSTRVGAVILTAPTGHTFSQVPQFIHFSKVKPISIWGS